MKRKLDETHAIESVLPFVFRFLKYKEAFLCATLSKSTYDIVLYYCKHAVSKLDFSLYSKRIINRFVKRTIEIFSPQCNVKSINLSLTNLSLSQWSSIITVCPNLQDLNLADCFKFTSEHLDLLTNSACCIESFALTENKKVSAASLSRFILANKNSLKKVHLLETNLTNDIVQNDIATCSTTLRSLSIELPDITPTTIKALSESCTNLTELYLGPAKLNQESITYLPRFKKLQSLEICTYPGVTISTVPELATRNEAVFNNLRVLDLRIADHVTSSSSNAPHLLSFFQSIESLSIIRDRTLNDTVLKAFVESNYKTLERLSILQCPISAKGLRYAATQCKFLNSISVSRCNKVRNPLTLQEICNNDRHAQAFPAIKDFIVHVSSRG